MSSQFCEEGQYRDGTKSATDAWSLEVNNSVDCSAVEFVLVFVDPVLTKALAKSLQIGASSLGNLKANGKIKANLTHSGSIVFVNLLSLVEDSQSITVARKLFQGFPGALVLAFDSINIESFVTLVRSNVIRYVASNKASLEVVPTKIAPKAMQLDIGCVVLGLSAALISYADAFNREAISLIANRKEASFSVREARIYEICYEIIQQFVSIEGVQVPSMKAYQTCITNDRFLFDTESMFA